MAVQHANITDPDLHEVKGASTATAGQVPVSDGSGRAPFDFPDYTKLKNKPDESVPKTGGSFVGPIGLALYTKAALPDALVNNKLMVFVTDASSGLALCVSNGTDWIDLTTHVAVV